MFGGSLVPLRILFVDMNAYFASVEQQDNPELRGKPVGIVPMLARSTSCLAASYEAKAYGIKTGTPVWEALQLCPSLQLVVARHERYVEVHNQIVRAVNRCLPVHRVMSIDEMACRLIGDERNTEAVRRIGTKIKAEICAEMGEWIRCSIGVAPNGILAKVASDMQKPDGLTIIESEELPDRLHSLPITDFPGIGPRMGKRFYKHGVFTTEQLCQLSVKAQTLIWGAEFTENAGITFCVAKRFTRRPRIGERSAIRTCCHPCFATMTEHAASSSNSSIRRRHVFAVSVIGAVA